MPAQYLQWQTAKGLQGRAATAAGSACHRLTHMQPEFLDIWERFYNDDEGKDVWLKASDGVVPAHSVFLAQLSEPLKTMFRGEMLEARTKEIDMPDFTSAQLRFIMRLAYTGHTDMADWQDMASAPSPKERKRRRTDEESQKGSESESPASLSPTSPCESGPPLDLLFGCTRFAKKYDIPGFCSMLLEQIKTRLDVSNFDDMMRFAISLDLSPLKIFIIRFADEEPEIKRKYDSDEFSAEVMFELEALWGKHSSRKRSTRKAF